MEDYQEKIEKYIHNLMSKDERVLFEKLISNNVLLKEEIILQKNIEATLHKNSIIKNTFKNIEVKKIKNLLRNEENKTISTHIRSVGEQYIVENQNIKSSKKKIYYLISSVAAIFILVFSVINFNNNSTINYYNEYANWDNLPTQIEKGDNKAIVIKIENLYNTGKFDHVIKLLKTEEENSYNLTYLGASYFHQKQYEKALLTFDKLSKSNYLDSSKGYWYKLIIYLHQNQNDKAKEMLTSIIENKENYNYKIALELFKKIK